MDKRLVIRFEAGTLLVEAPQADSGVPLERWCVWDTRVEQWRGNACVYPGMVTWLYRNHIAYDDLARAYENVPLRQQSGRPPRDYQQDALEAWRSASRRGVVVLPTGTGKTFVAHLAMESCARSTLVVVPTIDLMTQWAGQLERAFGLKVGMLGGGSKEVCPVTVATYDSALLMMEYIGNRFGLLVVDECHHLPGATYQQLARACLAPFRLGLSATPERNDGAETVLDELLGPVCYRREITEMEGRYLAPYRTEIVLVSLTPDEYAEYRRNRELYVNFVRSQRISFATPQGWGMFLRACARLPGGREAFAAYLAQRRIAFGGRSKMDMVWTLLRRHAGERTIVFTADNRTAYGLGERFLLPVLTHHTKANERKEMLDSFRNGEYLCLVTSKVLNEGVDVPEASVGIVVSGSGSTREHVQRLGRILRPRAGKSAVLYEIISRETGEWNTSDRRRQSSAYERTDNLSY